MTKERELLRFLTAGSVDDGKSTLIGRLLHDARVVYDDQLEDAHRESARHGRTGDDLDLSLLVDGLRAEREQGITIDVAYRYFSTARRNFIIADCPGHEQYTRNMATGASGCSLAIILVDARRGVQPQTRRHSFIASVLGIRHVVVAINKMDAVEWSEAVFDEVQAAYAEFAARLEFSDVRFIPLSALKGDNVVDSSARMPWYRGDTLLYLLEHIHVASDQNLIDLRFPVQYVNRHPDGSRAFCGTVASGVVHVGDALLALPSGRRTRVSSILGPSGELESAAASLAVALKLEDQIDISRGDMLVHPGNVPSVSREFDAMVVWLGDAPLETGRPYLLKHTTNAVRGWVSTVHYRIDVNSLERERRSTLWVNEIGRCTVVASRPLAHDAYGRNRTTGAFIVIDVKTNLTVGAGMILDRRASSALSAGTWELAPAPAAGSDGGVSVDERAARYRQRAVTVILSGHASEAIGQVVHAFDRRLFEAGYSAFVIEPAPGSGQVAAMLNRAGLICLVPLLLANSEGETLAGAVDPRDRLDVDADALLERCEHRIDRCVDRLVMLLEKRGNLLA